MKALAAILALLPSLPVLAVTPWLYDREQTADGTRCTAQMVNYHWRLPLAYHYLMVLGNGSVTPDVLITLEKGERQTPDAAYQAARRECNAAVPTGAAACPGGTADPSRVQLAEPMRLVSYIKGLRTRPGDFLERGWYQSIGVSTPDSDCTQCVMEAAIQETEYELQWRINDRPWNKTWAPWRTSWEDANVRLHGLNPSPSVRKYLISGFRVTNEAFLRGVLSAGATTLELRYSGTYAPSWGRNMIVERRVEFDVAALARAVAWVQSCSS